MADPVTDQPVKSDIKVENAGEPTVENAVVTNPASAAEAEASSSSAAEADQETTVSKSTSWWGGLSSLGSYIQQPHLLESGFNVAVNQVTQATSEATKMVKSKSMEVVQAVSGDLKEVKDTVKSAATPILPMVGGATTKLSSATTAIKSTIKELDEVTDDMAEVAINGVTKSVSSFWNMASGYASQMFVEDDLPPEAVLVGNDSEPIILDRLQAQLHALASDATTFTKDPDPGDQLGEEWASWLANLDLDSRQGEISDLMINSQVMRKQYSKLVPGEVPHKLFWARYFYKVHLIEKQEMKRQVLRARAEQTEKEEKEEIKWDDDEDIQQDMVEIPDDVQEKLLNDYENELKSGSPATKEKQHAKKDSSASDDWEKLSDEAR